MSETITMEEEFMDGDPELPASVRLEAWLISESNDSLTEWEKETLQSIREKMKGNIRQGGSSSKAILNLADKVAILEGYEEKGTISEDNRERLEFVRDAMILR